MKRSGAVVMNATPDTHALVDAVALARGLATTLAVEGLFVRVEVEGDASFVGQDAPVRRLLRTILERASSVDGSPYLTVRVREENTRAVFELPWYDDGSVTGRSERAWIELVASELCAELTIEGLLARVSFSREGARATAADAVALLRRLRDERAVQAQELATTTALVREARRDAELARMQMLSLRSTVHRMALDLHDLLTQLNVAAATVAERDPLGAELQSQLQSALDQVVRLSQETHVTPSSVPIASHVAPRVTTDEPDVMPSLGPSVSSQARTLPPPPDDEAARRDDAAVPRVRAVS
jgi:hypothetical protein